MKIDELVLHIGQSKTGTTTLQKTLSGSISSLRERGVLFPDTGSNSGNAIMLGHHLFDPDHFELMRRDWLKVSRKEGIQLAKSQWQTIKDQIARDNPSQFVVSSEHFFVGFDSAFLSKAKACFDEIAKQTRIVIYLRSPTRFYLSNLQEQLKIPSRSLTVKPRTFLQDIIAPWETHFPNSVALNIFDTTILHDRDTVTDFVDRYLPTVNPSDLCRPKEQLNTSLSAEAMAILHDINTGKIDAKYNTRDMFKLIRKNDSLVSNPTKPELYPNVARSVSNWAALDLFWLRDHYGLMFPDITYDDIDPDGYDENHLNCHTIEEICPTNANRKAELFRKAKIKYRFPKILRKLAARW